jgi:pimeloyl-ACP methyl ester carboxylesterase
MTATHLWFGTDARPLAGHYSVPDNGLVRGAVVLCQAFGMEAAAAAPTMRELAKLLVAEGLAVLRFDYDGTGDSAGDDLDVLRVESWQSSIVQAVEFLRSRGHSWVGSVGLRLGATLLAETLRSEVATSAAVLWDPCVSGRSFLREQQLLLRVLSGEEPLDDGNRYGPGVTFTAATIDELSRITLNSALGDLDLPTLIVTREGQDSISVGSSDVRAGLTSVSVSGQIELVGVEPAQARVPWDTLKLIAEWLSKMAPSDLYEHQSPEAGRAVVGRSDAGEPIVEYAMSIGTDGLFAICTEPVTPERSMSVVFFNAGILDHVGPSRLWVELSRRWAALGFRSYRFDLSGIGDSPPLEGMTERITRSVHSLRQAGEVVNFVGGDTSDVLLVGLCAGAYQAMEVAMAGRVRALFLVNPDFRANPLEVTYAGESELKRAVAESPAKWYSKLEKLQFLWPLARRFPDIVWRGINFVALGTSRANTLVRLGEAGVDTFVISNSYQAESDSRGRKARLRRLSVEGAVTFKRIDPLDHTVFGPLARRSVSNAMTSRLVERFSSGQSVAQWSGQNDGPAIVPPAR